VIVVDVDVLIVGAGPAGLYAAYYAGFRGLSVAIVDGLPEAGGQVTALYPEKQIYDVAGFPAVKGKDLVDALGSARRTCWGSRRSRTTRARTAWSSPPPPGSRCAPRRSS
jgi:cation diffusion facilitator CzcD-associated flavoprotein CzcO